MELANEEIIQFMSDNQLIKISTTDLVQRTEQQIAIANKNPNSIY